MAIKIRIKTPENIEIEYKLAGIGTRLMAFIIDSLIQGIALYLIYLILVGIDVLSREVNLDSTFEIRIFTLWITALAILIFYLISACYFIIFEVLMHGQTPGKRLLKIRVMKDNGQVLGFFESMIRNTLRMVDFLPGNYALGVTSIFLSSHDKRIGDYVAGTIVVKEEKPSVPWEIKPISFKVEDIPHMDRITPQEYDLIREFLERKDNLPSESSAKIATTISLPLMEKLKVLPTQFPDHTSFLIHLYDCYKRHSELM